jgi:NitT/TauT family transport system substrate-binding protein
VKLIMTNFRMVLSQWGAGRYEVTGNFLIGTTSGERFEKQGKKVREFVLSDYLPLIGHGIVVTDDLLASDPKTVAGFVKATQKAWAYLAKQPKVAAREAADVIVKNVEKSPPPATMVKYALKVIPSRMFSPSTRGKPLGWSNPDDWQKMIDVLAANDKLKRKPKVSDVVTNRFVK